MSDHIQITSCHLGGLVSEMFFQHSKGCVFDTQQSDMPWDLFIHVALLESIEYSAIHWCEVKKRIEVFIFNTKKTIT